MLVLSRKIGEKIVIGDNISVTVCKIRGHRVELGCTSPDDMRIDREEVAIARAKNPQKKRNDQ